MNILAVDTTTEWGSVAVRRHGSEVAEVRLQSPVGFGHLVFGAITEVLALAEISLGEIDCFAAASGPGSFTGVRVCLAAVKGLAEAKGKPAAGVSNLRALATAGGTEARGVILDARRGQVFAAVYNAALQPVVPESLDDLASWLSARASAVLDWITPATLRDALPNDAPWTEAPRYLAGAIAFCAERDAGEGHLSDPAFLDANYVRQSDAELFWKDS